MATLVREVLPTRGWPVPPGTSVRIASAPDGDADGNVYDQASIFIDVPMLQAGLQGQIWLRGGARSSRQIRLFAAPSSTFTAAGIYRAIWPAPLPPYFSIEIVLQNSSGSVAMAILRAVGCARLEEV